jgi:hypothetical protein
MAKKRPLGNKLGGHKPLSRGFPPLEPSVFQRLYFFAGLICINQLAALGLQESYFNMGRRRQPFLIRPAFGVLEELRLRQIPDQRFLNQLLCFAA